MKGAGPGVQLHQLLWECRKTMRQVYLKPEAFILQFLLWPLINLTILVCYYAPFTGRLGWLRPLAFTGDLSLGAYLTAGTFVVGFYGQYVLTGTILAWQRDQGVLEAVYLTPVHRLVHLLGNALAGAVSGLASVGFMAFGLILFDVEATNPLILIPAVLIVILTSLPWGALLCAIFLVGRNQRVLFSFFEEPAEFLAGVRFPPQALPGALAVLSAFYPISHAVGLLRAALSYAPMAVLQRETCWLCGLGLVYLAGAWAISWYAERRGKMYGTLSLWLILFRRRTRRRSPSFPWRS